MAFDKLNLLLKKSKKVIQEEGLFTFFKKAISFFFSHRTYYVYERAANDISEINFSPEVKNYKLEIIPTLRQLDKLGQDGYNFKTINLKIGINNGALPFCIFSGKEIVHVSWIAMNEKAKKEVDTIPFKIDFQKGEVCSGGSFTDPQYRGKGLLSYVYSYILPYLAEHGFSKVKFTIDEKNIASQKAHAKINPMFIGKGHYFKIFGIGIWKEEPLASKNSVNYENTSS